MLEPKKYSGLRCLQLLLSQIRPNVNLNAIFTDTLKQNYENDQEKVLLELASSQELRPEKHADISEVMKTYHGPCLLKLSAETWVLVINTKQLSEASALVFDPATFNDKQFQTPSAKLIEKSGGSIILFRNLQKVDAAKQTGLFCLCSAATHHGIKLDIQRVIHDYAIADEEPGERLLLEIAKDNHLRTKRITMGWDKLLHAGQAFPIIGKKRDGKYLLLCGMRKNNGIDEIAVVDPENPDMSSSKFLFWNREKYESECGDDLIFLKKIYRLSDESRPFGLSWFIPEFMRLKGIFGQIAIIVGMITLTSLVLPLFFQIVVDKVLVNKAYNTLNVLGIGIFAAILFNGFLEYSKSYFLLFATNKIDISTATKTFRHLMRLPIDFFERVPSGVLLKHMQQTEKIRGFLAGNLFFTILDLFSLFIFIPFLFMYSVQLTVLVLGYSLLMALVIACLIKPFQSRLNELYQAEGKRQSMLVESIHGIRTVKSLSLEPVEEKHWDDTTAYAIKSYFNVGRISITAKSISHVLELLMNVSVIWLGAHLVFDFQITIGALIAFQMLAGRVTGPLVKMVGLIHEYQQIALSVRMLGVVMNTAQEPAGGGIRNTLRGNVEFENVTFQYRPDLPAVVKQLSVSVPRGTTIGIVGRSGSGKTTLTKLLQGLYPVQQGLIKIDGIDIREIDKAHLRCSTGVVLQENYFFSGTVRENIGMTKRSATFEEIIYVSKLAGADDFIQKLTKGYDTVLEENASNLSGGQKQRLAIARALLANPPILIFDEATSALDPESEYVIQKNLKQIAQGRTVLIISHRLSIVSSADNILVLDEGSRSDYGSHKELLARPGIYQEFWHQQMGKGA